MLQNFATTWFKFNLKLDKSGHYWHWWFHVIRLGVESYHMFIPYIDNYNCTTISILIHKLYSFQLSMDGLSHINISY